MFKTNDDGIMRIYVLKATMDALVLDNQFVPQNMRKECCINLADPNSFFELSVSLSKDVDAEAVKKVVLLTSPTMQNLSRTPVIDPSSYHVSV